MSEIAGVTVRPNGLLLTLKSRRFRNAATYLSWIIRHRDWQMVRWYFSGYTAEYDRQYAAMHPALRAKGRGWTEARAIRNLYRKMEEL